MCRHLRRAGHGHGPWPDGLKDCIREERSREEHRTPGDTKHGAS